MTKRMLVALLALAGLFVALYLTLYKAGFIGQLTCSIGSCETVNTSRWATFLGLLVAAWGVGFYVGALALSLASVQDRWVARNESHELEGEILHLDTRTFTASGAGGDAMTTTAAGQRLIELRFELPADPSLETELSATPPRYWELEVRGKRAGLDLDARFLVPVYARPAR